MPFGATIQPPAVQIWGFLQTPLYGSGVTVNIVRALERQANVLSLRENMKTPGHPGSPWGWEGASSPCEQEITEQASAREDAAGTWESQLHQLGPAPCGGLLDTPWSDQHPPDHGKEGKAEE